MKRKPRHQATRRKALPRTGGSVLILALWSLFFLSVLAVAVGARVSAGIRLAEGIKTGTTAYYLARAGLEQGIMELTVNPGDWRGITEETLGNDDELFKNNSALPGGTFSVFYEYLPGDGGEVVTNFGVVRETFKIDVNHDTARNRKKLAELTGSSALAARILSGPDGKKGLATDGGNGYSTNRYESLWELLEIDGIDHEVFLLLEPHVTVHGRAYRYGPDCYGGVAEGSIWSGDSPPVIRDRRRIAFVYDRKRGKLRHWHEY